MGLKMRVRSRSNSAVKLDVYYRMVYQTILKHQVKPQGLKIQRQIRFEIVLEIDIWVATTSTDCSQRTLQNRFLFGI